MILLTDGINSDVVVTLTENVSLTNPDYIFIFVNDNTGKKVACKAVDVSAFPTRYNQFSITVKTNPAPLSGEVYLDNYGFFHYYAYEIASANAFNFNTVDTLDLETMTGLLEVGKMKYITTETAIPSYANTRSSIKSYGR